MSAAIVVPHPGISEAELIEIENRARSLVTAEEVIERRIFKLEQHKKDVPYSLELDLERIRILRADMRRLIELARERGGR